MRHICILTMFRKIKFNPLLILVFVISILAGGSAKEMRVSSKTNRSRQVVSEIALPSVSVTVPPSITRNQILLPDLLTSKKNRVQTTKQSEFSLPNNRRRVHPIASPKSHSTQSDT